jgi:sterol desaturase/sphingolipid hydroxylase (fatty acid hydroxylase superfamily)
MRLPARLERILRWLVVTPDMHRVHHSKDAGETDSNYGFNLSIWDRLFGTYRNQPQLGHATMRIGVSGLENPKLSVRFTGLLMLPFLPMSGRAADASPQRRPAHS